jgi:hypothetical protein
MLAAEDVQRQKTVPALAAVKKAPLLLPMHRILDGVQIQDDALGTTRLGLDEQLHHSRTPTACSFRTILL